MKESFHFPAFLSSLFFSVSQTFCERHHHHTHHLRRHFASLESYLLVVLQGLQAIRNFYPSDPLPQLPQQKKNSRVLRHGSLLQVLD
jgi:hypothetical protein